MKLSTYIFFLFSILALYSCKQSDPLVKESRLIWSDEFNGSELDENNWEIMLGNGSDYGLWGWGNNEDQWYLKENVSLSNGNLLIKAVKEETNGYNYSSARIRTANKFDFKYGRIEASIRMANTAGLWHAFWMLPTNPSQSWPTSGEMDIMEYVGNTPGEILNTIHFADNFGNHSQIGDLEEVDPNSIINGFHQYALEWNENQLVWFIDSVETFKVLRSDDRISSTWPFDSEFHLLLNTAVGGNLGGAIDEESMQKPKYMEVEYVRVYQNN